MKARIALSLLFATLLSSQLGKAQMVGAPAVIDFGNVKSRTCSAPQIGGFGNVGSQTVTVTKIYTAVPFVIASAPATPLNVGPGSGFYVSARFCAPDVGNHYGRLEVQYQVQGDPNLYYAGIILAGTSVP